MRKKLIAISVIVLLWCGTVLAAQETTEDRNNVLQKIDEIRDAFPIKFEAYGQTTWAPFVYRGRGDVEDITNEKLNNPGIGVGSGPGWDNISGAVGFRVFGNNAEENVGFDLRLRAIPANKSREARSIDIKGYDNAAYLWAKPFGGQFKDLLKVQMGAYQWDDLRGKIGGVGGYRGGADEDDIFQRVESDTFGALFVLKPPDMVPYAIKGLTLFGSFGVSGGLNYDPKYQNDFAAKTENTIKYIFSTPHAGLAFKHGAFGLARFQFIGSNYIWGNGEDEFTRPVEYPWYGTTVNIHNWFPTRTREFAQLEFAVNVTAIPNINLDLGVGIPLSVTVKEDDKGSVPNSGVGPRRIERGYRPVGAWTQEYTRLAENAGDVWQPPAMIALGLDFKPENMNLGFRFSAKTEFGEKITFAKGASESYKGGLRLQLGVEPFYDITPTFTASLPVGLRINGNDTYKKAPSADPGEAEQIAKAFNSYNHNGTVDLGLGAFLTKKLGKASRISLGVIANIPVGGDRYNWSTETIKELESNAVDLSYFQKDITEQFKKGNLIIAVPITIELNL